MNTATPQADSFAARRWRDRRVVVLGAGRSGVAAASLLRWLGARVVLTDRRPVDELPYLEQLSTRPAAPGDAARPQIELACGGHPDEMWEEADAVVVSPGVPADAPPLRAALDAGATLLPEVELAAAFARGLLVGVTGSNGKSTVTAMAGHVLAATGRRVAVCGNIGRPFSDAVLEMLRGDAEYDCWVVELSSFQTEAIESLRPGIAVFLNLTPDHLDRHGSMDAYALAKMRLIANCTGDDWVVVNADDPTLQEYLPESPAQRATFSRTPLATGPAAWIEKGGIRWRADAGEAAEEVVALGDLQVLGPHNAANAAAATVVGALAGSPLPCIAEGLRRFRPLEHRMESCSTVRGIRCINDSKATNVDATAAALEGFGGGVWLILGGRDKGSEFSRLRTLIADRVERVLLIGEAAERIAGALEGTRPLERCETLERAVMRGLTAASPGDVLLLSPACTSYDQFPDFEARGRRFKALVRAQARTHGKDERS